MTISHTKQQRNASFGPSKSGEFCLDFGLFSAKSEPLFEGKMDDFSSFRSPKIEGLRPPKLAEGRLQNEGLRPPD